MKRNQVFLIFLIVLSLCLSSCSKGQEEKNFFSVDDFLSNSKYMKTKDGGITLVQNGSSPPLSMTLYETYYALSTLDDLNAMEGSEEKEKIARFLKQLELNRTIDQEEDEVLYYYDNLAKLVGYPVKERQYSFVEESEQVNMESSSLKEKSNMDEIYYFVQKNKYSQISEEQKIRCCVQLNELFNGEAFSVTCGGDSHILATWQAVQIYNMLGLHLAEDKKTSVISYIHAHARYDGTYAFSEQGADIIETYYYSKILALFDINDESTIQLNEYLQKRLDDINLTDRDISTIYLIRYAYEKNIPLEKLDQVWESFFTKQQENGEEASIDLLYLVLDTIEMYEYPISEKMKQFFAEKLSILSERFCISSREDTQDLEEKIIVCSILYQLYDIINEKVSDEEVKSLISVFIEQYKKLENPLYATKWITEMAQRYGVSANVFDGIKKGILSDLKDAYQDGFYAYSSSFSLSFEATYHLLLMQQYLS